jgi:hypothetical protein
MYIISLVLHRAVCLEAHVNGFKKKKKKKKKKNYPLEFIEEEGHWFRLQFDTGQAYTAPRGRIEHYTKGTGY